MGMDVGSKKKGPRSDINVTPLIDVVLVLLIIFMVLTPSMLKHLTATVPRKAEDNAPPPTDTTTVVEYTAKRELSINNEPTTTAELGEKLKARLRGGRQKVVFFKADDEAPYGEVIRVMDIARGSGAEVLAVVTK